MKKIILMALLFSFSVMSFFALDMDSKEIFKNLLDEKSEEFSKIESLFSKSAMKARFHQTKFVPKFNRNLKSFGTMMLKPGKGMAWITEKPYESVMVVGKDKLKQRIAGGKVSSQNVEGNTIYVAIAEAMENVFSGRFSLIHDVFETYFLKEDSSWYIGLVPKHDDFSSFVSFITIAGKNNIDRVFMQEVGGNSILYEFENVELRDLNEKEEAVFSL